MDNILKPVLIAVIIILAVLIIWKANRFTTADQPEKETKAPPESKKPSSERPSSTPLEFFIVYQGRRVPDKYACATSAPSTEPSSTRCRVLKSPLSAANASSSARLFCRSSARWMTYPMTHSIFGGDVSYHGTKEKSSEKSTKNPETGLCK